MAEIKSCKGNCSFIDKDYIVSCLLCNLKFNFSDDIQPFLSHLLDSHNFLIEAPLEILDMVEYITYWRKLQLTNLQDYCVVFNTNTEHDAISPQATYYLLSQRLPEDKNIRSLIREKKLRYISNQMRTEWQDKNFSRKCIYCSDIIQGGLHNMFNHIKYDHNISLGNNIVFGAKLLDIIEDKLQKLLCLYCEKPFKNHVALRNHMRKKHHKSLNPKNKFYDKFYLVNYVKPGTSWEAAKQELKEELDEEDLDWVREDDQEGWEDWQTGDVNETIATCLFCSFTTSKVPTDLFLHMIETHEYNFEEQTESLSFYEKIKLVNYIRKKVSCHTCSSCNSISSSRDELLNHMNESKHFTIDHRSWDDINYFIPFLKNDGLLHIMKDDDALDDNSSGYASSNTDEIVFPETITLPLQIGELKEDNIYSACLGSDTKQYKCLFCSFITKGNDAKNLCSDHMECNHCFSYKNSVSCLPAWEGLKLVNYIRTMSDSHQCFACHKKLYSETGLVVHLQLCRYTKDDNTFEYIDSRWETTFLANDSFILDLEKRFQTNAALNEVRSKR